ncbi:MAG: hypothetical protein DWQ02_23185 [Bacteroidetes bacterium]|nr:MAG: hypothetical protein DWQ02_23185 [Bacteroidota bacterium]
MRNYSAQNFKKFIVKFFFQVIVLVGLTGCYEKQEGCLDIRATNFDLEADISCEDCCEYPDLKLKFLHRQVEPDTVYSIGFADSVYYDGVSNPFRINALRYYISNIRVVDSDGSEARINETIDISKIGGSVVTFTDDFLLVNGNLSTSLTAGSFSTIKTYNKVRFFIGLDNELEGVDPSTLPDNHVLAVNQDSSMFDFQNGHYLMANHEIYTDTTAIDTIPRVMEILLWYGPVEMELEFPESITLPEGFDLEITIQVDAPSWFETSDVRTISDDQFFTNIVSKLSESFSVIDVSVDN